MKRSSQPDEEETARDDGIVQAEPIIVDHPPKPDPKLLNTVLKVINLQVEMKNLFIFILIHRLLVQNRN